MSTPLTAVRIVEVACAIRVSVLVFMSVASVPNEVSVRVAAAQTSAALMLLSEEMRDESVVNLPAVVVEAD